MEVVAAIGTISSLIMNAVKLGNGLVDLVGNLKDAGQDVNDHILHVQNQWKKTETQLKFLRRAHHIFSDDHLSLQEKTLLTLVAKLSKADDKLRRLIKKRAGRVGQDAGHAVIRRWKYIFVKSYLVDTVKSLDKWQKTYDPTWFLIMRIADPIIDAQLNCDNGSQSAQGKALINTATRVRAALAGRPIETVHIFLSKKEYNSASTSVIPHCAVRRMQREGTDEYYLVDSIPCPSGSYVGVMTSDIRTLATRLYYVEPSTFSVLQCKGVVKKYNENGSRLLSFEMIFKVPGSGSPRSLRSCLLSRTSHTLTERMDLARQLARSVAYIHTLDFVHKSLSPESFIGFKDEDSTLGSFYVVGFEHVRSADGMTYRRGDADWHKNLYRSPERQGLSPEVTYRMQHDIYSLGVCLLEVGMWESFVLYGEDGRIKGPNTTLFQTSLAELQAKKPQDIKSLLVQLAKSELPLRMGEVYQQVVLNCLTCLDEDNLDFGDGDEFDDKDGIAVGVRYIEKILLTLGGISV